MNSKLSIATCGLAPYRQPYLRSFLLIAVCLSLPTFLGCGSGSEKTAPESRPQTVDSARATAPETNGAGDESSRERDNQTAPLPVQSGGRESEPSTNPGLESPSESTKPAPQPLAHRPGEKLTVAILEFEDTSPKDEFARLDRALQSMLTTDLSASRDMELVERARLEDIRAELNLVNTGFLDSKTAAKIGKGVGATAVLTGSFWVRDGKMRIDSRLVHVETGTIILAEEITGDVNEFTELEKQLARKVLDAAGVRLSAIETADLSKRHTSSLLAASRYGQALEAEDAGDLDEARREAAAALEVDPDFSLAQQLLTHLGKLIDGVRNDEFRRKVFLIARFEDDLNGHPFGHPRFKPVDYPQILREDGPERALFYWISRAAVSPLSMTIGRTTPYDSLFAHPEQIGKSDGWVSRLYLELGGAEPVLFWCDVVTSDPAYSPSKPLTDKLLNPDPLKRPVWGPYPAYFFWRLPDVYAKRFEAQAWIRGDFETAVETIESANRICRPIISETAYLRQLEELNAVISSPQQLSLKRKEARERQQLWQLARDHIINNHVILQSSRFDAHDLRSQVPNVDDVRQELLQDYAGKVVTFGGRAAQEQQAKQLVNRLLEEADGAKYVARRTPVFGDDDNTTMLEIMHIAGCPHSYLSSRARMAAGLPVPNAFSPDVDAGLTKCDDPQTGIDNGWIPCPHCRPLRWAESSSAENYLAEGLSNAIGDFIGSGSAVTKVELADLLVAFQDHPTPKARASLQRLCEHVCKDETGDRTFHAKALQAMARVTTLEDTGWLIALLESAPWWDVRINTAATLATIADDSVLVAINKAIERERYYFVRHGLEAARARAQESLFNVRMTNMRAKYREEEWEAAQGIAENLLPDVEDNEYLPSSTRLLWLSDLHWFLSAIGRQCGDVDSQLKHLRRAIDLDPDNSEYKNTLGYDLATLGRDLDEAEQLLRAAIALDKEHKQQDGEAVSENPVYLNSLGFVLFKQGRYAEAKELMARCLDFPEGQMLESYDHLGDIHWALGEKREAIAAWKKAIDVAGDSPTEQKLKAAVVTKLNERRTP